jgi:hypothetical protein
MTETGPMPLPGLCRTTSGRKRAGVAVAALAFAATTAACSGSTAAPSTQASSATTQGKAFETESAIKEIDNTSRVGLIDNAVIPYSTLRTNAASPVKIVAVQAMSPSAGVRVAGFVAYLYSNTPGSSSSNGPIKAPHQPLLGISVTHAVTYWWQVRLLPVRTGTQSVDGIRVNFDELGHEYHQLLPVTYVLHVHPADWRPPR